MDHSFNGRISLDVCVKPFSLQAKDVLPHLQLEIIDLLCNSRQKDLFYSLSLPEYYHKFPKLDFLDSTGKHPKCFLCLVQLVFVKIFFCPQVYKNKIAVEYFRC